MILRVKGFSTDNETWFFWYSHFFKSFPQFIMIHAIKGFGVIDETEIDILLEFPSFLYDLTNVGNSVSGSSSFFKLSLDI